MEDNCEQTEILESADAPKPQKISDTPLMRQYFNMKAAHPDAVLLFRVGDFYETYGEDAVKASGILGITLTRKSQGASKDRKEYMEMAGFPYHAIETYLPRLVRAGERVAICEQLEDPKSVKGLVKRGVTELVTPGVALNRDVLEVRENTFLAAVFLDGEMGGISFLDISTGEFLAAEGNIRFLDKLVADMRPKEIIFPRSQRDLFEKEFGTQTCTYPLDAWAFSQQAARDKILKVLGTTQLKGFGVDDMTLGICAAGAVLHYLDLTEHHQTGHINSIRRLDESDSVWIDRFTIRNLELFSSNSSQKDSSFSSVMDRTVTPMGARLLRRWIAMPLKDREMINRRLDAVESLVNDPDLRDGVRDTLSSVGDLERLASRIVTRRILPREINQLRTSLESLSELRETLGSREQPALRRLARGMKPLGKATNMIASYMNPDPETNQIQKGGFIRNGVSEELDSLRDLLTNSRSYMDRMQQELSDRTGIPSLRIGYNNVFGYYIEVRNAYRDKAPEDWTRKQTLANAERYITPELKELEERILTAQDRSLAIELELWEALLGALEEHVPAIKDNAAAAAATDCLACFAFLAASRNYSRPEVSQDKVLDIKDGRHPVIEAMMGPSERYIPNDLYLDDSEQQIMIITGPNMAGKSALLRQTALIVLMAQMGSFVPAGKAHVGIVDKIFTRVGASDNISQGESTFMVEMIETASILNNLSDRSLVLLDEIGRGTSTYDGISIAWAIVEYIQSRPRMRAKTMFATHYHELNEMEALMPRVRNFNVAVKEVDRNILFLRKLVPGGTEHSFGIHVAKMAGMPMEVVASADQMLVKLEKAHRNSTAKDITAAAQVNVPQQAFQMSMFQLDDPVLVQIRDRIKGTDINNLTPLEALNMLSEIKRMTGL